MVPTAFQTLLFPSIMVSPILDVEEQDELTYKGKASAYKHQTGRRDHALHVQKPRGTRWSKFETAWYVALD